MKSQSCMLVSSNPEDMEIAESIKEAHPELLFFTAFDTVDALKMFGSSHLIPNFILLDANTPRMDAMTFIRTLKLHRRLRRIKVFVRLATHDKGLHDSFIKAGASGVFYPHSQNEAMNISKQILFRLNGFSLN